MRADKGNVDAPGDYCLHRRIGGRLAEAVEAAVLQVRNARRELETQQHAQGKDMVRIPAATGVMAARRDVALMVEQGVQHMQRLAGAYSGASRPGIPISCRPVIPR